MRKYSNRAANLREQYELNLEEIERLEQENLNLEQEMRDETGGCDCFAARIGCPGHARLQAKPIHAADTPGEEWNR